MNTTTLKNTLATILLTGLVTHAHTTMANSVTGALGAGRGTTDYYRVTCSKNANGDTYNLKVNVLDLLPVAAPLISVQAVKGVFGANTTDAVDGDATNAPSPTAIPTGMIYNPITKKYVKSINSGNGVYDVRVNKTAVGVENYKMNVNCYSSVGKLTGIAVKIVQNQ
ncbi:MAG: hypothetical protein PHH59_03260 [Methylovulum sp.]|uniref:hypothetical protein n=1 Tax=Methylovulum sp. TaxID=1916980 RepID=UPI002612EC74|nr:hypothetical protein [Methylovulum sp.]MDD2723026.1 hypothetical protein [Methylovulum sp.]MDD5124768.1 hypothetical protein [Methylovulum sp.]